MAKKKKVPESEREERFADMNSRVSEADEAYKTWEDEFQCDKLEDYYLGHQEKDPSDDNEYVINLVFPTIEIKIPTFLFTRPEARIIPRPGKEDDIGTNIDETCRLLEDTAQSIMTARTVGWRDAYRNSLQEAFYRFGVVEHGFSSETADNPNGGKPLLDPDGDPYMDGDDLILQPMEIPVQEQIWTRRIPAAQFRAPAVSHNELTRNDWLGYYDWMHPEDIKSAKGWENTSDRNTKISGMLKNKFQGKGASVGSVGMTDEERYRRYGLTKVWRIWDLRSSVKYIWPENGDDFFVYGKPFDVFPFSILRFHPILDSFYPLPPVYNWIKPQDELNETRNTGRIHRRRSKRRYLMLKNAVDPEEQDKLQNGPDMTLVEVKRIDGLKALEDAPLDREILLNVPQTQMDFMRITGVGGEQQGVAESKTATQANIITANANIRDTFGRQQIGDWVSDGIYSTIQLLRANSALPYVLLTNVDFSSPGAMMEMQRVGNLWKTVEADDLGKFDFDVMIDIESMSPQNDAKRQADWNQMLSIFANPTLMMVMLSSDVILKKTLGFQGIKSDRELQEIKRAMAMVLHMQQAMAQQAAQAKAGGAPGAGAITGGAGGPPAPGPTPGNAAIAAQLMAGAAGKGLPMVRH